jgi:hypothetical protein
MFTKDEGHDVMGNRGPFCRFPLFRLILHKVTDQLRLCRFFLNARSNIFPYSLCVQSRSVVLTDIFRGHCRISVAALFKPY